MLRDGRERLRTAVMKSASRPSDPRAGKKMAAPRGAYACAGRPSNVNFGPFAFIFEYVGREMTREGPVGQRGTRGYDGKPWEGASVEIA